MKSLSYIPASDGSGDASLMTITQVRTAPATSITVNTVAGVPSKFFGTMGTPHTFSDPVTGETITIISEATAVNFAGHVDSGKIEIDAIADGETDLGSKVGDIIIIRPTTPWANNLYNVLSESLDDDGTLKDKSVTLPKINGGTTAGVLTTDASGNVAVGAKTTDANGWTVYNYGAWKEYTKKFTGQQTTNVGADGNVVLFTAQALPTGMTSLTGKHMQAHITYRYGGPWAFTTEALGSTEPDKSTTLRGLVINTSATPASFGYWAVYVSIKE